jgi:hypothetical protein
MDVDVDMEKKDEKKNNQYKPHLIVGLDTW